MLSILHASNKNAVSVRERNMQTKKVLAGLVAVTAEPDVKQ